LSLSVDVEVAGGKSEPSHLIQAADFTPEPGRLTVAGGLVPAGKNRRAATRFRRGTRMEREE
jgi:hypothetical protein